MPSQDSELTMAGWETANSMLLQHNSSHLMSSSSHDEFVSKYMAPSFLSRGDSTPTSANRLSVTFPPGPKRLSASFPSFCTKDNVDQCISYLDQELTTLGFPSLYVPDSSPENSPNSGDVFNLIQMVNCTYELIQRHQKSLHKQEELENKQMRNDSDFSNLQSSYTRIKEQLEQTQRDNIALEEKERQHAIQHKGLSAKFKNAKEEIKKLEGILKSRDVQFRHDLKKKEREINKMKERVHQLLTDKNQERRIGMDILNSLQRTDGKRGTWKTGKTGSKHEEEMYRLIITNYEERQKELMLENQVLRESLSNMQKELVDLLNRQGDKSPLSVHNNESDTDVSSVTSSVADEISTGHFQMPFEMVREGIETDMKQKWRKLKEHIERMEKENKENTRMSSPEDEVIPRGKDGEIDSLKKEVTRLKAKVKTYKELAEQQEQVLQSVQDTQMDDTLVSFLRDSHLLDEKESLADEKKLFYHQKATFEKERRSFTEAAIRLGHERRRFEEERSNFLQQQLMAEGPTSSNNSSSSNNFTSPPLRPPRSISKANSPTIHIRASSPETSPVNLQTTPKSSSHMHRIATPTTVELYRALKLLPDNGECLNSSRESLHAPSLISDTDNSGLDSPPPSGTTTPRSSSGRSCTSQSSYRSLSQASNRSRSSAQSGRIGKGDGGSRRRNEEHKQNLRIAVAQKKSQERDWG